MENNENNNLPYIRVAGVYYKISMMPTPYGFVENRIPWPIEAIRHDTDDKQILKKIPQYDGFCIMPEHVNYQKVHGFGKVKENGTYEFQYLNQYKPLPHNFTLGSWNTIEYFLKHIFEEHYNLILDYFAILLKYPLQKLPIIILISREGHTGKTTFLNFCKSIFSENATFVDNASFRSQFNSDWLMKNLILTDETLQDKTEDTERFKNWSTALELKVEAKGKDKVSLPFFGKFILCSNNINRPISISETETRFWVREVKKFKNYDVKISEKLNNEIPHFLHYLTTHKFSTENKSRMWFDPIHYKTQALERIIRYSKPRLELELAIIVNEIIEDKDVFEVNGTLDNILALTTRSNLKTDRTAIKKVLCDDWGLTNASNSLTYTAYYYSSDGYLSESKQVGRYYTITKDFIKTKI